MEQPIKNMVYVEEFKLMDVFMKVCTKMTNSMDLEDSSTPKVTLLITQDCGRTTCSKDSANVSTTTTRPTSECGVKVSDMAMESLYHQWESRRKACGLTTT